MSTAPWRFAMLAACLVSSLLACARTPAAHPDRVALERAIQRWTTAVNVQDTVALAATMTDDVELDGDTSSVTGRDAATRALREWAAQGKLAATSREITIANDVAWHVVDVVQIRKSGDVHARGKALEIWKRVGGEWRLHRRVVASISPGISLTRPPTDEPALDRSSR